MVTMQMQEPAVKSCSPNMLISVLTAMDNRPRLCATWGSWDGAIKGYKQSKHKNPEGKLFATVTPNVYCMVSIRIKLNKADKNQEPRQKDANFLLQCLLSNILKV